MKTTATPLPISAAGSSLTVGQLKRFAEGWLLDSEMCQHTFRTLEPRKAILDASQYGLPTANPHFGLNALMATRLSS